MRSTGQISGTGSALLIALWALLLLSAAIFAWVQFIDQGIARALEANLALEAKALAHSGVAVALHPGVTQQTPLLAASMGQDRSYKVTMTGEGGKLNLNYLLTGEQPARLDVLKAHLARRGLTFAESAVLIDSMLDWIDGDNVKHLNGVEDEGDYHAPNRGSIITLDEVQKIRGSTPLVSKAGWKDDFTIYSNPGLINLQFAPLRIVQSLPGVGEGRAQRFVQIRQGPDKTDGTKDDKIFKDINEALSSLGIGTEQGRQLTELVTLRDQTVHVLSVGQAGQVYRQVEVVARKLGGSPQILLWNEN